MGLKVEFIDGGYEIIDNAHSYDIHAEEGTLRVAVEYESDVLFNFDCVKSVRYVDPPEEDEDEEDDEAEFTRLIKELFKNASFVCSTKTSGT